MLAIWRNQTRLSWARLLGLVGTLLVLTGIGLWLLLLSTLFTPEEQVVPGRMERSLIINFIFSLVALVGVLMPWPLLSAFVLLIAFVGSFVVGYGWYFLLTPALAPVGVGGFLYLVAAIMTAAAMLAERPRRNRDAR